MVPDTVLHPIYRLGRVTKYVWKQCCTLGRMEAIRCQEEGHDSILIVQA